VKLLHPHSNELEILRHLHWVNSPYNHTIPLLEVFELYMGTFVLLPEATPLDHGFALGKFHSEVVDFSQQLIVLKRSESKCGLSAAMHADQSVRTIL